MNVISAADAAQRIQTMKDFTIDQENNLPSPASRRCEGATHEMTIALTQELKCSHCDATDLHYEVMVCVECNDRALCCDCATDLQRELDVCSDKCALAAIRRIRKYSDSLFTRSLEVDRRDAQRRASSWPELPVLELGDDCLVHVAAKRKVAA
jgi:hypothetical protein